MSSILASADTARHLSGLATSKAGTAQHSKHANNASPRLQGKGCSLKPEQQEALSVQIEL